MGRIHSDGSKPGFWAGFHPRPAHNPLTTKIKVAILPKNLFLKPVPAQENHQIPESLRQSLTLLLSS